jgi:hypothetical protein
MQSKTKSQSFVKKVSVSVVVACFALILGLVSTGYSSDIIIGNFEDGNDGWGPVTWDTANAVLTPASTTGVTLGDGSLAVQWDVKYWVLVWNADMGILPASLTGYTLKFDVTFVPSDFVENTWVRVAPKIALNSDIVQPISPNDPKNGWAEWADPKITAIDTATGASTSLDWGTWAGTVTKTYSVDISDYNKIGAAWFQVNIAAQLTIGGVETGTGKIYVDNVRLIPPTLDVKKCTVTAGKTQYAGDLDFNDMKDTFVASGTISSIPSDPNTVSHIDVNIISADGGSVFFETNDFNYARNVKSGKYTHKYKIPKGNPVEGAITSMAIDFNKKTFSLSVANADLTGLYCPLELSISMDDFVLSDEVNEAIVNGSKKLIPTRLMRMDDDKLVVNKAKAKHSTVDLSDSMSVTGDIAVIDTDVNLCNWDVNFVWGDQMVSIPPASFKASKTGHLFKCSKAVADANGNPGFVTASIDIDKATFSVSVSKTRSLNATSALVPFGISFADFNEVVEVNTVTRKSW